MAPHRALCYHPQALYNEHSVGAWRSLVARIVRDDEVGGSNPLAPTRLPDPSLQLEDGRQRGVESEAEIVGRESISKR